MLSLKATHKYTLMSSVKPNQKYQQMHDDFSLTSYKCFFPCCFYRKELINMGLKR